MVVNRGEISFLLGVFLGNFMVEFNVIVMVYNVY